MIGLDFELILVYGKKCGFRGLKNTKYSENIAKYLEFG
jgi:hypothetical protein